MVGVSLTCCFLLDRKSVMIHHAVRHAEIQILDSRGVQVLEDEVESQIIDGMVYRPVGSVDQLQGVQEWWVSYGFEVGPHKALK